MEVTNLGGGVEMLVMMLIFLTPVVLVLFSKFIPKDLKPVWLLIMLLFSWVGYLVVYTLVIKKHKKDYIAKQTYL